MKDKLKSKKTLVSLVGILIAIVMCLGFLVANSETVFAAGSDGTVTIEDKTDDKENTSTSKKDEESNVRYPNKLTPKPATKESESSTSTSTNSSENKNKGEASEPSKARASVTENKDNANEDYPVHNGDDKSNNQYSADARQFITFQTKNGKVFHLVINHDEDTENVLLLTEVSEDDLLNMVEKKEPAKQEVVKEDTNKEDVKPVKKEESDMATYVILGLVVIGALGAGYYFKVVKKKEEEEIKALEEEDDDNSFFSKADEREDNEEYTETTDTQESIETD